MKHLRALLALLGALAIVSAMSACTAVDHKTTDADTQGEQIDSHAEDPSTTTSAEKQDLRKAKKGASASVMQAITKVIEEESFRKKASYYHKFDHFSVISDKKNLLTMKCKIVLDTNSTTLLDASYVVAMDDRSGSLIVTANKQAVWISNTYIKTSGERTLRLVDNPTLDIVMRNYINHSKDNTPGLLLIAPRGYYFQPTVSRSPVQEIVKEDDVIDPDTTPSADPNRAKYAIVFLLKARR